MKLSKLRVPGVALLAFSLFVAGCETAPDNITVAPVPTPVRHEGDLQSGASATENQQLANDCYQGEPKLNYDPPGAERRIIREGYALLFSSYLRVPLWVSEHHLKSDFKGDAVRREKLPGVGSDKVFLPDPTLPAGESPTNADYAKSGFDRGHQAAAAMFHYNQDRLNDTYYYSNMAPQVGLAFNRGAWAALEAESRNLITAAGEGWVITGAIFHDPKDSKATTVDAKWIGKPARVAVPTHFYKIVITRDGAGKVRCHAFILENADIGTSQSTKDYDWKKFQVKVSEIEKQTGINFMPNLSPTDRQRLEETVDPVN